MACTKRLCGYLLLGFGLFFIIVGIVCGIFLPKMVAKLIESKACIDSSDDPDYDDWVKPKSNRFTKLYYWIIKNKEGFLYDGETPQLEEKGPYTYQVTTQKVGVEFKSNRCSYYDWNKKAVFLKEKSCTSCGQNDNLTVLNSGYLATMEKFGGDHGFSLINLPGTINKILKEFNNDYTQLGNVSTSLWQDPDGSNWTKPGFGSWMGTSFTEIEMRGLYGVLGNLITLFGSTVSNATVKQRCLLNPTGQDCGFIAHCRAWMNDTSYPAVKDYVSTALCQNITHSCFNTTLRHNATKIIYQYMNHVAKYTMWRMLHEQDDIVTTIAQDKLALGYTMKHIRDPSKNLVKLPGLIKTQAAETEAKKDDQLSFYTCDAEKDKHYQWAGFKGNAEIPSSLFNLTEKEKVINGYNGNVPHSKTTGKPCSFSRELPMNSFEVFFSPIYLKFTLTEKEDTSLHGLDLKRFVVSKESLLSHGAVQNGLIDQSKLRKFPFVLSFPHFLYLENLVVQKSFHQEPQQEKHDITYDVDPVTGVVMRARVRAQLNYPIKSTSISLARIKPFNISYKTSSDNFLPWAIPVVWMENSGEATESDVDTVKKKVIGLLSLSCGLVIALPVIGILFVIVFIAILAISVKANQVTEMQK